VTSAICALVALGALGVWGVQTLAPPAAPTVTAVGARPDSSLVSPLPAAPTRDQITRSSLTAGGSSPAPAPAIVTIPALNVAAEIDRVGVQDDGQVVVPKDGRRIGWYRYGPAPGAAQGSAVLVGHRDTREQGPGVLYRLGDLDQGDEIQIVNDDWTTLRYEVRSREVLQKSAFPGEELFRRDGAPVLTLITCGGEYVEGRGYSENVVITAVPLDPAA
jgi:sortase (surface protein transpeptidase)